MPVPFPTAADTRYGAPDQDEVAWLLDGFAGALDDGAGLSHLQTVLVDAVAVAMTGVHLSVAQAAPKGPVEFAEGLARRDRIFRERIAEIMVLGGLVVRPPSDTTMARIGAFCEALNLDGTILEMTAGYADGAFDLAVHDFDRNGYLDDATLAAAADQAACDHLEPFTQQPDTVWAPSHDDTRLADRWRDLGGLPDGTIGRGVFEFYQARGFRFPGDPDSAPPLLAQHDWVHVLADYGTSLESELEVFAYIARANDDPRAFSLLAMVISLFETGRVQSGLGLFEANVGNLSRPGMTQRVADAMRRGALTRGSNDFMAMDWFEVADRPVDVIRSELAMPAKSAEAVQAGSVGPWQRGGISAYQIGAGEELAQHEGREYDCYGAQPLPE